jgi:uracil-DNA glycosylase family 4
MGRPFFQRSSLDVIKAPAPLLPRCGACGLYRDCASPKMPPTGNGVKGILIVGEAPGRNEDRRGEQFVGDAGRFLRKRIAAHGVDPETDVFYTNALICRPPQNRTPSDREISYCRPNLTNTIRMLNPSVIIPLGGIAVKSLIGSLWREDVGKEITRWLGWQIPCQSLNAWICPNWHPSFVIRQEERDPQTQVVNRYFDYYLSRALKLRERPWKKLPEYDKQVDVVFNIGEAADRIDEVTKRGGYASFDYETNMLKPDNIEKARIVCCAIASYRDLGGEDTRKETFSFPMHGQAVRALKNFLKSEKVKKIGANIKFEERWSRAKLGVAVKGWAWDIITTAHVYDNRRDIISVKFQAFVTLGQDAYDDHIRKYLKAPSGYAENKIKEIPPDKLLHYCGMDALLELEIAERQMRMLP